MVRSPHILQDVVSGEILSHLLGSTMHHQLGEGPDGKLAMTIGMQQGLHVAKEEEEEEEKGEGEGGERKRRSVDH